MKRCGTCAYFVARGPAHGSSPERPRVVGDCVYPIPHHLPSAFKEANLCCYEDEHSDCNAYEMGDR